MNAFFRGKSTFLEKSRIIDFIAYFLVLIFTIVGIIVSINRYFQYEVYHIDFGQYDQAIWQVAHFRAPMVDHFVHGYINVFADHFTPSVFILSPLYWITSSPLTILYAQAIAVGLSGYVLYLVGNVLLKNKFLSLVILICYFMFVGLQNAVITEFHELTVMSLFLMLIFWAFVREKRLLYFLFLILTLGFKEVTFLLGIGIGLCIFFLNKRWRKEAVFTILISALWGFLAMRIVMPYFSAGGYLYAQNIPESLWEKMVAFVDEPQKRRTLFYSFFSFGFLPIFSPEFWAMMAQDYAGRFVPKYFATRWGLGMHYNAESAVILALSSVYSFRWLLQKKRVVPLKYLIGFILIFLAIFLNRFVLNGPFNLVYNKVFYEDSGKFGFLDVMIKKIPPNATVATHNNLAAHLTHNRVWLLRGSYADQRPDYILLDKRSGQSPNNYLGSVNSDFPTLDLLALKIVADPKYEIIYQTEDQYILKRK